MVLGTPSRIDEERFEHQAQGANSPPHQVNLGERLLPYTLVLVSASSCSFHHWALYGVALPGRCGSLGLVPGDGGGL